MKLGKMILQKISSLVFHESAVVVVGNLTLIQSIFFAMKMPAFYSVACMDQESFVRVGPTLTGFF